EPDLLGCRIYRADSPGGPYQRVGAQTAPGATSYTEFVPGGGVWHYLVRAVKRQTTASASYENLSQGVHASALVELSGFSAWAAGLSNPTEQGDPNADRITNLLAYAVGAENGNANALPQLPQILSDGTYSLDYSFRNDLHYEVQLSLDLKHWYSVALKEPSESWALNPGSGYPNQGNIGLFDNTNTDSSIPGEDATSISDNTPLNRRFWRLKVRRPPPID
ncbi:MAG: hypothetical protein KDM63_11355, partial [Verrucomicrobiae bacterium]|nr:hypothetical protein [Verrucomicrobiae bacterium]